MRLLASPPRNQVIYHGRHDGRDARCVYFSTFLLLDQNPLRGRQSHSSTCQMATAIFVVIPAFFEDFSQLFGEHRPGFSRLNMNSRQLVLFEVPVFNLFLGNGYYIAVTKLAQFLVYRRLLLLYIQHIPVRLL